MYVHNYVPDPIEVPGNVTQEPHRERLAYIRRVAALHGASVCAVAALALAPLPALGPREAFTYFALMLMTLTFTRIAFRGVHAEVMASLALLPLLLGLSGMAAAAWSRSGFPVWAACVGLSCALIYTFLCGRDFSFVGQFVLSLIVSSALVSVGSIVFKLDRLHAAQALSWNTAYLLYYVYDSASLLARRRRGEELAAVVDLYRDLLNVFGWTVRVVAHWRKHRIWTLPPKWS